MGKEYKPLKAMHPGVTLREKLEEMGVVPSEFAKQTGISVSTITDVLDGNTSVTPEMAKAFAQVTKIPAHFWLNAQHSYDDYKASASNTNIMYVVGAILWAVVICMLVF